MGWAKKKVIIETEIYIKKNPPLRFNTHLKKCTLKKIYYSDLWINFQLQDYKHIQYVK